MILEKKSLQYILMLVAASAVFMDYLDTSIVSIALPAITADFGIGSAVSAWVMTGYLLALSSMLLVFGKLADRTGRYREIFITGFVLFTLASFLCGISSSILMLILCRVFQGASAALMVSTATMLVMLHLPEEKKGLAAGMLATLGAAALAFGPGLGGIIAEYLSWHWIFFINIPIGIIGIIGALFVIPKAERVLQEKKPFDIKGAFLLAATLLVFLAGLEIGNSYGWSLPVIILLAAAPVLGFLFLRHEMKHADPVLPANILQNKIVICAAVSCLFITIVYLGSIYILPFYLTGPLGFGSALAGIIMLIPPVTMMLMGVPAGTLTNSFGCKKLCNISAIIGISASLFLAAAVLMQNPVLLFAGLILLGATLGINEGPTIRRITIHCTEDTQGSAGSLTYTVMNVGSVVGIAAYSVVASAASGSADIFTPGGIAVSCIFGAFCAVLSYVISRIAKDSCRA
ncbi:MAG: MFS transporter [Methanocorpusculum parvum]|nr:MFS transporter [Methanocorpusculum parvum]